MPLPYRLRRSVCLSTVWHGASAVLAVASLPCLYVVAEPRRIYQTNTPTQSYREIGLPWTREDLPTALCYQRQRLSKCRVQKGMKQFKPKLCKCISSLPYSIFGVICGDHI